MSKTGGHIHLQFVGGGEPPAFPFPKMRRAASDIDYHIQHLTLDYAAKLRLRSFHLIVKPSQSVCDRSGMIVLNEAVFYPQRFKLRFVIAFEEKPSFVLEDWSLYQTDTWK